MSVMSIRVSQEERAQLEAYAAFSGKSVSAALKGIVFEWLDDEYDLALLEKALASASTKTYSMDEAAVALGISDVV